MQQLFTYFLDLLKSLPIWMQLITIPIVVFTIILFKSDKFRDAVFLGVKRLFYKLTQRNIKTSNLFVLYKQYLSDINRYTFSKDTNTIDKDKDFVFKTLLRLKVQIVVDKLKMFTSNRNIFSVSKYELFTMSFDLIYNMIECYEKAFKLEMIKRYGDAKGMKVYEFALSKFNEVHQPNIVGLDKRLINISNSNFLSNNRQRVSYLITEIHFALRMGLMDAEAAFNSINGTISKIVNEQI